MYIIKRHTRTIPMPAGGGYQRLRIRHRNRGLSGLADTCWLDATTGAQVCNGSDVTGQTSCSVNIPYYTPTSGGLGADNGKPPRSMTVYGSVLTWTPASGNKRTFNFLYHSGYNDVYQYATGGMGGALTSNYAVVSSTGVLSWSATAPAKNELGCSNITTAVSTGTTYQTVTSTPVATGSSSLYATTPYVSTTAAAAPAASSGFSLSSIPTWGLVAGGIGGTLLLAKMVGKR